MSELTPGTWHRSKGFLAQEFHQGRQGSHPSCSRKIPVLDCQDPSFTSILTVKDLVMSSPGSGNKQMMIETLGKVRLLRVLKQKPALLHSLPREDRILGTGAVSGLLGDRQP